MKRVRTRVCDHALLRHLERVGGFDIEGLRQAIARAVDEPARAGATGVVIGDHVYRIRDDGAGPIVTTVIPRRSVMGPGAGRGDE